MLDGPSGWTKRLPKALMKSAPIMGLFTSATWKRQLYRTPLTLRVIWRVPNDLIREPLAATRLRVGGRRRSEAAGGIMLTSAPVSMRKSAPELVSLTWRRDTFEVVFAAEKLFSWRDSGRLARFPGSVTSMES